MGVQELRLKGDPGRLPPGAPPPLDAGGAPEPHLVGIDAGVEELVGGEDHRGRRGERVDADLLRATFREEVPGAVEGALVPHLPGSIVQPPMTEPTIRPPTIASIMEPKHQVNAMKYGMGMTE